MDPNIVIWIQALIEMFIRHQQGTNVTADLIELQSRVRTLLEQEQAIANTPPGSSSVSVSTGDN